MNAQTNATATPASAIYKVVDAVEGLDFNPDRSWFAVHDSIADFHGLKPSESNAENWTRYSGSSTTYGKSWFGFGVKTVAGCDKLVSDGWQEGAARLDEIASGGVEGRAVIDVKRRVVRGDQGDEFDIHRAYAGGLDTAWSRRKRGARLKMPVITLAAVIGGKCGNSAEELFWRGAAVAKLADLLAAAGYGVEVIGAATCFGLSGSGDKRSMFCHLFPVKRSDQPMDLSALAATLAFPGFMRASMFRAQSAFPGPFNNSFGTYGNDAFQQKIAEKWLAANGHGAAHVVDVAIYDRASAEKWVDATITAIESGDLAEAA